MSKVLLKTYRSLNVYPIKLGVILTNKRGKAVSKEIMSKGEYEPKEFIYGSASRGYVYDSQQEKDLDMPTKCLFVVLNPFSKSAKIECPTAPHIIAHEAVHIKNYLYGGLGIESDINNDEPEAYLVGAIVKLVLEMIEELKGHEDYKKGFKVKK